MIKAVFPKNISPFLKDIVFTSFVAVIVAVCNIFVIRIIAQGLGAEELGIYTLVRRTVASLLPFTSLSIGIGLARYIALDTGRGKKAESILPAAVLVSATFSLLVCLALFPFSELLSKVIFKQEGKELLFKSILFLLFGENLFICLYAYYRGQQKMLYANIWAVLITGIIPLSIALLCIHMNNISYVIFGLGSLFYLSLLGLLPKIVHGARISSSAEIKATAKKLLTYSIPRAPGGVALTLIFSFGVLASPYTGGIAHAAYMSIGIWMLQILQTATDSFGLVILPKAANFLGSGNEKYLVSKLRSLYDLILHVGLFTVIQVSLLLDFIIYIWLGAEYSDAVPIARIIILSMLPFFFFTMMKNIIDAVERKAINAFNMYFSLFVTITSSLLLVKLGLGVLGLAISLDLGLMSLGALTCLFMKRRYPVHILSNKFFFVFIINLLMGFCVYFIKFTMMSNQFNYQNVAIVVSAQLACGILYLMVLWKLDAPWIIDIKDRIAQRKY